MLSFIAVGPPKTGTTLLQNILMQHPDIFLSEKKEIQYFNYNIDKGEKWYHNHFVNKQPHQIVGEISPTYCSDLETLKTIKEYSKKHNTNIKIIITYRDPVKRLVSEYHHRIRRGAYSCSLAEAIATEISKPKPPKRFRLIRNSSYYSILTDLEALFDKSEILIINCEQELYNPEHLASAVKNIEDFLGVKNYDNYNFDVGDNASFTPKSIAIQKLVHQDNVLKKVSKAIIPSFYLRERIRKFVRSFNTQKKGYDSKIKIDDMELQKIYTDLLKEENEKFLEAIHTFK